MRYFVLVVLAFCVLVAVGCGGGDDPSSGSGPDGDSLTDDDSADDDSADDDASDDDAGDDDTFPPLPDDDTDDDVDDDADDDTTEVGTSGWFDPTESDGFYSMPFPNDLRIEADGTIRVLDAPNPRGSLFVDRYLAVGDRDVKGFGANSAVLMRFTGSIDPGTLPADEEESASDTSSAFLVSIDPDAPDYGRRYPLQFKYNDEATVYAPEHFLVMLPLQGVPAEYGRRYAAVVTTQVTDAVGDPLVPPAALTAALDGTHADAKVNDLMAPLAEYLTSEGYEFDEVAQATVYTTGRPIDRMVAMRDQVYDMTLPAIDTNTLELRDDTDTYWGVTGQLTIPIYQKGQVPYVVNGGDIAFDDDGAPIVQRTETTRFMLTIPKGSMPENGWPLLVYSHGSGGSYRSFVSDNTAVWLARNGIAAVSIDAPHHGPRNPISQDSAWESFCFYNALNPTALRDNEYQAATELMAVLRETLALTVPGDLLVSPPDADTPTADDDAGEPDAFFDPEWVFFMGHSQGSTVGPLITAVDPHIRSAYFSGAGASFLWNILEKTNPFPIKYVLQIALHLSGPEANAELDEFHPMLNIAQHFAENADTMSFNPYFHQRPVPGTTPKSVMQALGVSDTYVCLQCQGSFAASASMDLIEPEENPDAFTRMVWTGGEILPDDGVTGNRLAYDGEPVTSAMVQYPQHPDGGDGHFVTRQYESMHRRVGCFFRTEIDHGLPTVVNKIEDELAPCEE